MEEEFVMNDFWVSRNIKGEALAMLDSTPIEGIVNHTIDGIALKIAQRTINHFACFKRHWAFDGEESDLPAYLLGTTDGTEPWEYIGTITRIWEADYIHYKAFGLFDD
jgi:hypothetical protein